MIEMNDFFCPNECCKSFGIRNEGNLVKTGTYATKKSDKYQMLKCKTCGERFSETKNSIFFGSHLSGSVINAIIRSISEGNGIRETGRILSVSKESVNKIVLKAGKHVEITMSNLLKNLHLTECQMDELWSFVNKKNAIRRGCKESVRKDLDLDSI